MIGGSQLRSLLHAWRAFRLRLGGAEIGPASRLAPGVVARLGIRDRRPGAIRIGREAWIEEGVVLDAFGGSIALGASVYLGPGAVIFGHGGVIIGDHCLIAMHTRILSSNHPVPPLGTDIRSLGDILLPTKIGRDVWLGAGVTVLGGVTIGDGCVVGAGAVVTKDLPTGAIAYGVPATVRSYRPAPTA